MVAELLVSKAVFLNDYNSNIHWLLAGKYKPYLKTKHKKFLAKNNSYGKF